jgi:hypothetical protein
MWSVLLMPEPTPRIGVSRTALFTSLSICAGTVQVDSLEAPCRPF